MVSFKGIPKFVPNTLGHSLLSTSKLHVSEFKHWYNWWGDHNRLLTETIVQDPVLVQEGLPRSAPVRTWDPCLFGFLWDEKGNQATPRAAFEIRGSLPNGNGFKGELNRMESRAGELAGVGKPSAILRVRVANSHGQNSCHGAMAWLPPLGTLAMVDKQLDLAVETT